MVRVLGACLLIAAAWRGWLDWQATIGEGNALRFADFGTLWTNLSEAGYARFTQAWVEGYPWDTAVTAVMGWPAAPVLLGLGALFWVLGGRGRRRKKRLNFRRF